MWWFKKQGMDHILAADMTLISAIWFAKSKWLDVTALQFCSDSCVPENVAFFISMNKIDNIKNDGS